MHSPGPARDHSVPQLCGAAAAASGLSTHSSETSCTSSSMHSPGPSKDHSVLQLCGAAAAAAA
eukprot:1161981-Pelagomonas_calceolata.AAC.21